MITKRFDYGTDGRVYLQSYALDRYSGQDGMLRPAILVLPGGGYSHCSTSSAEPVALTWAARGYSCFVLYYSCMEHAVYEALAAEAGWAIKTIRDHAEEFHIDPDKLAVMGFSAGASFGGMIATQWHLPEFVAGLDCDNEYLRPNAAVLGYGPYDLELLRQEQAEAPLGEQGKILTDLDPHLGVCDYVDERTAPIFMMHCRFDEVVDVRHSLRLADALTAKDRPFELMLFQSGVHGLGVNNKTNVRRGRPIDTSVERWVEQADIWMQKTYGELEWVSPANAGMAFL